MAEKYIKLDLYEWAFTIYSSTDVLRIKININILLKIKVNEETIHSQYLKVCLSTLLIKLVVGQLFVLIYCYNLPK